MCYRVLCSLFATQDENAATQDGDAATIRSLFSRLRGCQGRGGGGGLSQSAVRKTTEKPLTLGFIIIHPKNFVAAFENPL